MGPLTPSGGRKPRRKRNWRLTFAILAGILAAFCASGSLVAYVWYDKATAPDRTTPALAVRQYGNAYLGEHDDAHADEFACADQSGLAEIKSFRNDLDGREKANNFTIYVNVDAVREVSRSGDTAHVAVTIVLLASENGQQLRRVENWDFTAKRQDGWRACGAHRVS